MFLLDKAIFNGVTRVTCEILQKKFFYDNESMARFLDIYIQIIGQEYVKFAETLDRSTRFFLASDILAKKHFTSYFISLNLNHILVDHLHFSDLELQHFDNLLPKLRGVLDHVSIKQSNQRTTY